MKIRMQVGIAGPGFSLQPGDEYECSDREAVRLIEAGFAVPCAEQSIETATIDPMIERRRKRA